LTGKNYELGNGGSDGEVLGGKNSNLYFADLFNELDQIEVVEFSLFNLNK